MLCLRVIGPETSRTMSFDKSSINIGRVQGNDVVLPSPQVSKQHVQIIVKEAILVLIDISSVNGTYLNGLRVLGSMQLRVNDEINVGPYRIKIMSKNLSTQTSQEGSNENQLISKEKAEPTRPYIRKMLNYILKSDSELDEFCIDYLPEIRQRITSSMDRTMKINLIIENANMKTILSIVTHSYRDKYVEFADCNSDGNE